ncbi:multimerin-2a [Thalassophryne amazonica]|uniref:multimerin-2a n=1 Tax=Thalassophryne amazonica TaxID=390379 RepID=UPI0014718AAF|nr:multimerin-2a [Thalassophryne amazonica]
MAAMGRLVLVLALLVSVHCEVRARDPDIVEDEEEQGASQGGSAAGAPPHLHRLHPRATTPPGEGGIHPARSGNWCTFVHQRVITMAAVCGSETYTVKSQSPCPSGTPDCQLVMYKLSTRPVYRQKQTVFTALLWRCCPGHSGPNCEGTVTNNQLDPGRPVLTAGSKPGRAHLQHPGVQVELQQQRGDLEREQSDHQGSINPPHSPDTGHAYRSHHTPHDAANQDDHEQLEPPLPGDLDSEATFHYPEAPAVLPVPHMMALLMSQLQPVLQGFNRSLEQLSRRLAELGRDVDGLRRAQPNEGAEERLDSKLNGILQNMEVVQRQLSHQRTHLEERLHSQHAMLHYNLTSFKADVDLKLKRNQKVLQISLQTMNATLEELKLDQDLLLPPETPPPLKATPSQQPTDTSALWAVINQLDNMVVNNTVKVTGLLETTSGDIQQLKLGFKDLEERIAQTGRNTQILFMETGLEVEEAKVKVLTQVSELAGNLSQQGQRLQETEEDVDYLYTAFYKQSNISRDCDCKDLAATVGRVERGLANVTVLAYENRLALDENKEGVETWGGISDWEPVVEALQRDLQQVKESLAFEQSQTRTLHLNVTQLRNSVVTDLSSMQKTDRKLEGEIGYLNASFASLLKDAIRHSEVLKLLLGEEVLEFLDWPESEQEANSIPVLKEHLRNLEEQLSGHNLIITSVLGNGPGDREEAPSSDQPSTTSSSSQVLPDDWPPGGMRTTRGGSISARQELLHPEGTLQDFQGDSSDLWNLEKVVDGLKVTVRLEEKPCTTTCNSSSFEQEVQHDDRKANLQEELTWLKRGLEDHLRLFKNTFSNADVLARSDATLDLEKLWQLVKTKEPRDGRGGGKAGPGRGGNRRSRSSPGSAPVLSSQLIALLFVMTSPRRDQQSDIIVFEESLDHNQFYSDIGTFTAPVDGTYLFVLTMGLTPGPSHIYLRRSNGTMLSLHQHVVTEAGPITAISFLLLRSGERVWLELRGGAWVESEDNLFAGLLLNPTT